MAHQLEINAFSLFSCMKLLQLMETSSPFSVAVFNDLVYWSDTQRRVIHGAHKITGKNHKVILKRPGQPFGLKVSISPLHI